MKTKFAGSILACAQAVHPSEKRKGEPAKKRKPEPHIETIRITSDLPSTTRKKN